MDLRPNASKAQTTKVSDVSFSRLVFFFSPFRDMNFPSRHSACLFLAEAADVRGGGVKKAN